MVLTKHDRAELFFRRDLVWCGMRYGELRNKFSAQASALMETCSDIDLHFKNQSNGRTVHVYSNCCRHRCCPVCQSFKHARYSYWLRECCKKLRREEEEKIGFRMSDADWWGRFKFITISPFVSMDLKYVRESITCIRRWFAEISKGKGGISLLRTDSIWNTAEVTYDRDTGLCHPHVHYFLYYDGKAPYIDDDTKRNIEKRFLRKMRNFTYADGTKINMTLSDGRPQETVSIDYSAVDPDSCFELTKYMVKTDDFVPGGLSMDRIKSDPTLWDSAIDAPTDKLYGYIDDYLRLCLALKHVPHFASSGKLRFRKEDWKTIIQNGNCTQYVEDEQNVVDLVMPAIIPSLGYKRVYVASVFHRSDIFKLKDYFLSRCKYSKIDFQRDHPGFSLELVDRGYDSYFRWRVDAYKDSFLRVHSVYEPLSKRDQENFVMFEW